MNDEIEAEHEFFLETVRLAASAIASRRAPVSEVARFLEDMAMHVDYQARVSIIITGSVAEIDVFFNDSDPSVSIVQRDSA